MNKAQLDLCREMIKLFNKASFNLTGLEMLQNANVLSMFSKMIIDEEKINSEPKSKRNGVKNGLQEKETNQEKIEE